VLTFLRFSVLKLNILMGGKSMTPEEKGRILLEYEECKKELSDRRAEMEKAGEVLGLFASLLQREPENIVLPSQKDAAKWKNAQIISSETEQLIDVAYFRRAMEALRNLVLRFESLDKKKKEIGF
ncbi:MAG: hypothetical protein QME64_04970, partial [bacterium]|nr:hypothetical protein [bacterium]